MSYAPQLNQSYRFENGRIIFEDGTTYTLTEAAILAKDKVSDEDLQAIHLVKKILDGEIQSSHVKPETYPETEIHDPSFTRKLSDIAAELGEPPLLNGGTK